MKINDNRKVGYAVRANIYEKHRNNKRLTGGKPKRNGATHI